MYRVEGFTNYECTCGEDEVFGEGLTLQDAIDIFLKVIRDDALDFSELDDWIDDWAEEDESFDFYGGAIRVYEEPVEEGFEYREILLIRIMRDPIKKVNEYSTIEFGAEINNEEKELCKLKLPSDVGDFYIKYHG